MQTAMIGLAGENSWKLGGTSSEPGVSSEQPVAFYELQIRQRILDW